LAATGVSIQADPLLPSLKFAPAVEVDSPSPEPLSVAESEPEPAAPRTPIWQAETPPLEAPPPESTIGMDRLAEPAVQVATTDEDQLIWEAEASAGAPPVP